MARPWDRYVLVVQLRDAQLARMRELGVIASIQPGLPGASAKEAGFPELVARGETRWRDLADGGVRTIVRGSPDSADTLLDVEVLATVVGRRIEHCAERVRDANMCS